MSSNKEYHDILKFLYFEGYVDSYAEAEELLESMTDEEFEDLIESHSNWENVRRIASTSRTNTTPIRVGKKPILKPDEITQSRKRTTKLSNVDIKESIIEYLFVEGYTDTIEGAEEMAANISESWVNEIMEAAKDQSDKQIDQGVKKTYKAGNVLDNLHQGRSKGINKLPATERDDKVKRMRARLKARRDDLFQERDNREDAKRAELKKLLGL